MTTETTSLSLQRQITGAAQQVFELLGLELLDVQVQPPARQPVVVLRIDRLDEQPVTLDDLSRASRTLKAELDRLDPIAGEYRLELESPRAKRPLLRARHFERILGSKARVRTPGQTFTAPIKAVSGDLVTFDVSGEDVTLPLSQIQATLAEFQSSHR